MNHRIAGFVALVAASSVAAAGYLVWASGSAPRLATPGSTGPASVNSLLAGPHLLYLASPNGLTNARLAVASLADPAGSHVLTDIVCDRVYAAAGSGLCLSHAHRGGAGSPESGYVLNASLGVTRTIDVFGVPSRVRISADGRTAAITTFVSGHSYTSGFSTSTVLVDLRQGDRQTSLESFRIEKDGRTLDAPDLNVWGVTFAPAGSAFYATAATAGHYYLIRGDRQSRHAEVVADGAECPSLSPDGSRVVYKKRHGGGGKTTWSLAMLDLATMHESALTEEKRSVDDQVEWLNDQTVLYGLPDEGPPATLAINLWALGVVGGIPRLLLKDASSPSIAR